MDARETLERRIDELCRENERLRQDNAKLRGARDVWQENDVKLRELARDMWWQLLNAYDYKEVDDFADRMRELGILEEA